MDITLEDIRPADAEATIDGEVFSLRKFNAGDEAWIRDTFGADEDMSKLSEERLFRIIFHQLKDEDKLKFKAIDLTIIDESGTEFKGKIGGWKLLRQKVSGVKEKADLFTALAQTVGISRPMWDKILTDEEKKIIKDHAESSKKDAADGKEVKKKKATGRK